MFDELKQIEYPPKRSLATIALVITLSMFGLFVLGSVLLALGVAGY